LHGAEHEVIPDRIEAGTFLVAGAMAGKEVVVHRADAAHLTAVIDVLRASGHEVEAQNGRVAVRAGSQPRGARIITEPYPGFPTDMQAQLTALLATTPGVSAVVDKIFPDRFMHVPELIRMGARMEREGNTVLIEGVERLSAAPVMASDLRASAALVLAALLADGVTEIHRLYHIDRGYEHIDLKLGRLGAEIERVRD
jgi:UDP-N-acetylglucosamine 1-carboxyvinyltransferase